MSKKWFTVFSFVLILVPVIATSTNKKVHITVPQTHDARIRYAISTLRTAMTEMEWTVEVSTSRPPEKANRIYLLTSTELESRKGMTLPDVTDLSRKPESYVIKRTNKKTIWIVGRDAVGTLYGAFALIDQVQFSGKTDFRFQDFQEREASPFLTLRGVNPFLHVQALIDTRSWYFSDEFWTDYLDRLARTRHNFLDIHAAYDLKKTNMPNIFPFFFTDDKYPHIEIPLGREQRPIVLPKALTERIFVRFQEIINMAYERGIRVGLMNYNTQVRTSAGAVSGQELVTYTQRCVKKLLKKCPRLWMFGFRVGESGQSEDFFQKAYLEPTKRIRPDINVYTRTWGANPGRIIEMGRQLDGRLYIEPKYNGEQLGLPYQAITSPIEGNLPTSYSFDDYCSYPQPFKIIWQVRANGTHRIFRWGDADFVRRAVKSCALGSAAGYTVEPMTAYYPLADFFHKPHIAHEGYFRWVPQRNWFWYELWGRLAYDPSIPDRFFEREFQHNYGNKVGADIFKALGWSSKIVPMIFAYHRLGPDHRQMAPEMEVGNDRFNLGDKYYPGTLLDFILAPTLDQEHFQSIAEYVDAYLDIPVGTPWPAANVHAGGDSPNVPHELDFPTAKFGPYDAVQYWFEAATKSLEFLKNVNTQDVARDKPDFECLAMDVQAVAHLGRYYAYKTLGATDLGFFYRTNDFTRLQEAREYITKAAAEWDTLATITEQHYRPFPEWLRMKTDAFSWRKEGKRLVRDQYDLDRAYIEVRKMKPFSQNPPNIGFAPVRTAPASRDLTIPIFIYSREALHGQLFCRSNGSGAFKSVLMKSMPGIMSYAASIPAKDLKPGTIEYFWHIETWSHDFPGIQLLPRRWLLNWMRFDQKGSVTFLPAKAPEDVFTATIQPESSAPDFIAVERQLEPIGPTTKSLTFKVTFAHPDDIKWVKLYYKPLSSYQPWLKKPVTPLDDAFTTAIPVSSKGVMYYFEACDRYDRATFYPDFRLQAPYLVIESWE